MRTFQYLTFAIIASFCFACSPSLPDEVELAMESLPEEVDFNLHVKPVLSDRCFACHGPDAANMKAGLRLDVAEAAYAPLPDHPNKVAVSPKKLANSEMYHRLISEDPATIMPPPESSLTLTPREKAILIKWIEQGAEYQPHWAFMKPERPNVPNVKKADWIQNPIDNFVLKTIEDKNWQTTQKAEKEILLRRVSFDLIGLPPSIEEMDAFLADESPEAYEKAVDRLLASPQYGERMATDWMDVSRFADTHGYTVDRYRDMSPWRDWVIQSFNENMDYKQFVTWQLAGDLLPNPTREQILATAFNRNHQQNMEGGIVQEEFRVEYVADRTNTLGTAFLGLTMECARCHDHKFDPISQKNYFEVFSFFNNINEAGQISWDNAMPVPTMLLTNEKVDSISRFISNKIEKQKTNIAQLGQAAEPSFQDWLSNKRPNLQAGKYPNQMTAHFNLNAESIVNRLNPSQKGTMKQQGVNTTIVPDLQNGKEGKGLLLDGDAWLDLGTIGVYDRHEPFSIGIWVNIPEGLENGVLFHKGVGAAIYNLRGYHIALKDNRLELMMAHTAPYNTIIEYLDEFPREEWMHLTLTYDGSSKATGLKLYMNGKETKTEVDNDNLYKNILFNFDGQPEAGLQIGARWRGIGARGATVDEVAVFNTALTDLEVLQLYDQKAYQTLLKKGANELTTKEKAQFKDYYLARFSTQRAQELKALQQLHEQHNNVMDTVQEIMVMQEMEKPKQAYILERGQYDMHGEEVFPNTPENVLPMPEGLPKNRLGLAQWLFHEDHPLTARVAMNRMWQQFFGNGLVSTSNDFGNQGTLPTHPELLDWLSVEFSESGWDMKNMVKLIVTSATYQQSSLASKESVSKDPNNELLARGPSARLTAEMIRDNALVASDLLVKKIGGESVHPYQPDGLWRINGTAYKQDEGDKLYRRSLYTIWKRTVPNPTQATFDAPDRANCNVKRQKTSTPLQALVLMNDPVYVEAAKVIGQRISENETLEAGVQNAFRLLTGRHASEQELQLLLKLQQTEKTKFVKEANKMKGWLNAGDYILNDQFDETTLAANTVVASTILNSDAAVVKR
ncbi:MAG: DUF1553 domain-containing protein [Bacteroidota bacterium]